MTSWNYRVIKKLDHSSQEHIYQIHEVYYSTNGSVECWNDTAVEPMGVTVPGLRNDIQAFLAAFRLPVMEEILQSGKPKLIEEQQSITSKAAINDYAKKIQRASDYINQIIGNQLILKKEPDLRQAFEKVDQALSDLYNLAAPEEIITPAPIQAIL